MKIKMNLLLSVVVSIIFIIGANFIFETKLDFVLSLITILIFFATFNYLNFYRLFFVYAGFLFAVAVGAHTLDPDQLRYTHYIFRPSNWVFINLFLGTIFTLISNKRNYD